MATKPRFKAYIDFDDMEVFDAIKEATDFSYGVILQKIIYESTTFLKIREMYKTYSKEDIKRAFLDLPFKGDLLQNNKKNKEQ